MDEAIAIEVQPTHGGPMWLLRILGKDQGNIEMLSSRLLTLRLRLVIVDWQAPPLSAPVASSLLTQLAVLLLLMPLCPFCHYDCCASQPPKVS